MTEKTRTIPCEEIPGMEEHAGKSVVIRKIKFGEKTRILDELISIDAKTFAIKGGISFGKLQQQAMAYGIESAPFFEGEGTIVWERGVTPAQIQNRLSILYNLDEEATPIFQEVMKLNPNLLGRASADTKNSQPSSPAKTKTSGQSTN